MSDMGPLSCKQYIFSAYFIHRMSDPEVKSVVDYVAGWFIRACLFLMDTYGAPRSGFIGCFPWDVVFLDSRAATSLDDDRFG